MDWTEVIVTVSTQDSEKASDICQMIGTYGIYIEDYSEMENDIKRISAIDMIEDELLNKDRTTAIIHVYISPEENASEGIAFLCERLTAESVQYTLSTAEVAEDDWANNWKKYFKPLEVGERLLIKPEWEPMQETNRIILEISPGVAFGTGYHETTQLCLEQLEHLIKPESYKKVLDIGCGSGILSIASILYGASSTVGVDIDPLAVKIAAENGNLNNLCSPRYEIINGDLTEKVTGKFDIVVANIVADVIISLTSIVSDYLAEGGTFLMSGIIDDREGDVCNMLISNGFQIMSISQKNVWRAITACLKPKD